MIRPFLRSKASGLALCLLAVAAPVAAQYAERPADRLSRYLRELSSDPTSLNALIGAGQAAIDVGDGNAALGFFARADERAPRNGQVKAGLARALLMVDNPAEALKMFDAARKLGIPDAAIAGDRGLAHDLRGDNKRAQQDYALALIGNSNDEVTKRYALSLGITGNRDQALRLLDPLLYKRDQGAWRARAFVLAMNGDTAGASKIVYQVMPERMAQTMVPFLGRLAALTPAQKAAAVHLGEMPSNIRFASNAAPQPVIVQPTYAARATLSPTPRPVRESREPRRRPGAVVATVTPTPVPSPSVLPTPTPAPAPVQIAQTPASAPPTSLPVAQRGDLEAIIREIRAAAQSGASLPTSTPTPVRVAQLTPRPAPRATPAPRPKPKIEPVKVDPKKAAAAAKEEKAAKAAAAEKKKKPEPPKNPARIWVQVAGGANAGALPREWSSVSAKAAELKGKGPWTSRNNATNRLLAGPFKTEAEAQAAVSRLRKAGVGAFRWQSDEGEAVQKLGAK